jgi:hydroxymethylglutaryl-CoA synthase
MTTRPHLSGLSGLSVYVPPLRVRLEDWCQWHNQPWGKIQAVVGRTFRMAARHESVYTMAANAVLRLIEQNDLDPRSVGYLALGTESSTDNSAGAVIVKGLVDRALAALGRPTLPRSVEVPELKHACLGGVYAMKGAARYLATDGAGKLAIVVSGDIAEYARGSSGEQTQGAGAVAMLLESEPRLLALDLANTGSSSDYRGGDFRKPVRRHFMDSYQPGAQRLHDFPVFNGRYSTYCYLEATIRAADEVSQKLGVATPTLFEEVEAIFFHRPYHHMPVQALAALMVWGLAKDEASLPRFRALCETAKADPAAVFHEIKRAIDFCGRFDSGAANDDPYPVFTEVTKAYRDSAAFKDLVARKLSLGSDGMKDLGNLYTAAMPAWIASGLEDAQAQKKSLAGKRVLLFGYGSGDAAEVIPATVCEGWEAAAARIGFRSALDHAIDLRREQYEALHDGEPVPGLAYTPHHEVVIDRIGVSNDPQYQDIGLEYYRFVP